MNVAFVVYDGMTSLDFIGVYDALTRLKTMGFVADFRWDICARSAEIVDGTGLHLIPSRVGGDLGGYEMLVVPGGGSARALAREGEMVEWIRTAAPCRWKVSVCSGALLLGAAGFLRGRRATTHRTAFKDLEPFCATVVDERIVDEGDVVTARGVTSSIDLGLYLVRKLVGDDVAERIRSQMDYLGEPWRLP